MSIITPTGDFTPEMRELLRSLDSHIKAMAAIVKQFESTHGITNVYELGYLEFAVRNDIDSSFIFELAAFELREDKAD